MSPWTVLRTLFFSLALTALATGVLPGGFVYAQSSPPGDWDGGVRTGRLSGLLILNPLPGGAPGHHGGVGSGP